jgi:hypothetical protein
VADDELDPEVLAALRAKLTETPPPRPTPKQPLTRAEYCDLLVQRLEDDLHHLLTVGALTREQRDRLVKILMAATVVDDD